MDTGWFRTFKRGEFKSHLFITSHSAGNGRVWYIDGKRYETLAEVKEFWPGISEEYLMELVLKYGKPRKST